MGPTTGIKLGIVIIALVALAGSIWADGMLRAVIELGAFVALLSLVWKARLPEHKSRGKSAADADTRKSGISPEI